MQNSEKDISVIIPVYNSNLCIQKLMTDIHDVLHKNNLSFEIIVVDDASSDGSWKDIKEASSKLNNVKAFLLAKNFGQHKATLCGFHNSCGKIVVTIDDDFEHNPNDIILLYNQLKESNSDVVYGTPTNIKKSFVRKINLSLSFIK